MRKQSDKWRSKTAFVLASIGAAVGLGNIWRFPYIASENGGIWFLIPYIVCLLVIGIPLFMLEAGQGFLRNKGLIQSVERSTDMHFITKNVRKLVGITPVIVSTVIMAYYTVLCGWTLWFVVDFVLGNASTFTLMQQSFTPVVAFVLVFAFAYVVVTKGVRKGIEPITDRLVPLLFV